METLIVVITQSAPLEMLESHELCAMTLEYRRECVRDSVLQSLTAVSDAGISNLANSGIECQHLLRFEEGAEIVRGGTEWRPKKKANNNGNADPHSAETV